MLLFAKYDSLIIQVQSARKKLEARLQKTTEPLDYSTALRIVRDAIKQTTPAPVVVAEGANTMDNARYSLKARSLSKGISEPRVLRDPQQFSTRYRLRPLSWELLLVSLIFQG